jgi:hypothetical protein
MFKVVIVFASGATENFESTTLQEAFKGIADWWGKGDGKGDIAYTIYPPR